MAATPRNQVIQVDQANELLRQFYAADGATADSALEQFVGCLQIPIRKFLSDRCDSKDELDELCGETIARLLETLRRSRTPKVERVRDGVGYAKVIARNVFSDYVHARRPGWYRLKLRVLYLLEGRAGARLFARWQVQDDWLCGLVAHSAFTSQSCVCVGRASVRRSDDRAGVSCYLPSSIN